MRIHIVMSRLWDGGEPVNAIVLGVFASAEAAASAIEKGSTLLTILGREDPDLSEKDIASIGREFLDVFPDADLQSIAIGGFKTRYDWDRLGNLYTIDFPIREAGE